MTTTWTMKIAGILPCRAAPCFAVHPSRANGFKSPLAFRVRPANFRAHVRSGQYRVIAFQDAGFSAPADSTVILWTVILAALFSGRRWISDGVFVLSSRFWRWRAWWNFTAWRKSAAWPASNIAGCLGGVLLMVGTFLNVTGQIGTQGSPARVNDFETGFLILFVLGLCLRQFFAKANPAGHHRHRHDAVRPDVCAVAAELHPENQFLSPASKGKYFLLYFILRHQIQRHGRVCRRLAHRPAQDDSAHQPRQNVGRFRRRDSRLDRREPGVRAFLRRPHGRHELASRRRFWASC